MEIEMDGLPFSDLPAERPIIGDNRSVFDLAHRFDRGLLPLLVYGSFGGLEQLALAPFYGQVPLAFGFTLETPWSPPEMFYQYGFPGQDQGFQWEAQLAGQRFGPLPIRTHTTGILDWAYRHRLPYAAEALDLVHPGKRDYIDRETPVGGSQQLSSGSLLEVYMPIPQKLDGGPSRIQISDTYPNFGPGFFNSDFKEPEGSTGGGGDWPSSSGLSAQTFFSLGFSDGSRGVTGGLVRDYTTSRVRRV